MSNIQGTWPNPSQNPKSSPQDQEGKGKIQVPLNVSYAPSYLIINDSPQIQVNQHNLQNMEYQNYLYPSGYWSEQQPVYYTFDEENQDSQNSPIIPFNQHQSQFKSQTQQEKQIKPEQDNKITYNYELPNRPVYDNFKILLGEDYEISSQFSSTQSHLQNEEYKANSFKIVIPQFNLKQYVQKNNIKEELVQCPYFSSSGYSSESEYFDQFPSKSGQESDHQVDPLEITVISSSSFSLSSSLSSQSKEKSSSQACQIVPVVNLLDENSGSRSKDRKNMLPTESKKDKVKKKKKTKLSKIKDDINPTKKEKEKPKSCQKEYEAIKKKQPVREKSIILQSKQVKQDEKKKISAFPSKLIENIIKRKNQEGLKRLQTELVIPNQIKIPLQQTQQKLQRAGSFQLDHKRTGKKQSKKQKKERQELKYKSLQIPNVSIKKDDTSQILSQFKRSSKLQQILMNHHHQKAELLNCVLFNNFYFQDLSTKIPQASKIPLKFTTIEAHQRVFQSNIKNELYYQIREKIKQLDQIKQNFSFQDKQNSRGIFYMFPMTVTKQSKVQNDGLCEITAVVSWPRQDFKIGKILNELMQSYRSRYRLFMFVDEHKLNVLCQIRDISRRKDQEGETSNHNQVFLKLVAGVDLRQSQKDQKINWQSNQDRNSDKLQQFIAKFYDLDKITTTIRQYEAILNLKYCPLAQQIMDPTLPPKKSIMFTEPLILKQLYELLQRNYNPSQMKAINQISSESEGIQLLQGPPGTGKTSTLVGLLSCQYAKLVFFNKQLLKFHKKQKQRLSKKQTISDIQQVKLLKILICAPSNSAVDLIANKILQNGLYAIQQQDKQKWSGQKRYKRHKEIGDEQFFSNLEASQSKQNKLKVSYRKCPQILRIGVSTKQLQGQRQDGTDLTNFDLYHVINEIFLKQLKGTRKELTRQQVLEKIQILSVEIKQILSSVSKIIENNKEYDLSKDISVNNKLNVVDLKKKIIQALNSIVASSGQVLKKMKFSANAFYIKDVIKFIEITIISQAQILLTTLATSYSEKILTANPTFTCLIVDQAAQATEPSVLIPLQFGVKKVILIGDQCQLPPTVKNPDLIKNQFNRSLFQRIWQCRTKVNAEIAPNQQQKKKQTQTTIKCSTVTTFHKQHMLDTQYRMNSKLRQFPSLYFYDRRLQDAAVISTRKLINTSLNVNEVNFIDCTSKEQKCGNSYINRTEGQCVVAILAHIMKIQLERCVLSGEQSCLSVGVITPYSEQQKLIKNLFNIRKNHVISSITRKDSQPSNLAIDKVPNFTNVTISTVDSYQGQQRDIIIISTVRSNNQGNVGFLQDERRINVALTRAKFVIIVIGNSVTLKSNKAWDSYIEWVKSNASYFKCNQIKSNDFTPLLSTLFKDPPPSKTRWSRTKQRKRNGQVMQQQSDSS